MDIRKITTRTGFEFIFAAGIAAIFIIPSAVMAQSNKSIEITINNGDTVINGRNIKELNPQQRIEALKDMNAIKAPRGGRREMRIERRMDNGIGDQAMLPPPPPSPPQYGDYTGGNNNNADRPLRLKRRIDTAMTYTFKFDDGNRNLPPSSPMNERMRPLELLRERGAMHTRYNRRNTQSFNYSNTDAQGVSTTIGYRVTDHNDSESADDEKTTLNITDLKLIADFTSGKTTLMFNVPAKGVAEVTLTNSEGATLFTDRTTSGVFSKTFPMALNGRYVLKVRQGGKVVMKDIFKEQ